MASSWLKTNGGSVGPATSIAVTFTGGNTSGNAISVHCNAYTNTNIGTLTPTDTNTNTYTNRATQNNYAAAQDEYGSWSANNIGGGANTVTISSFSTNSYMTMAVTEVQGVISSAYQTDADAQGGSPSQPSSGSATSTTADTTWVGGACHDDGTNGIGDFTVDSPFVERFLEDDQANYMPLAVGTYTSTGAESRAYTCTLTTATDFAAGVTVFEGAAAGGAVGPLVGGHLVKTGILQGRLVGRR